MFVPLCIFKIYELQIQFIKKLVFFFYLLFYSLFQTLKSKRSMSHQNSSVYRLPFQYEREVINNLQKIKLYMSQCQQPIPDIVNQNEDSIYSHFKFYFNDQQFMIQKISDFGDVNSAMHDPQFEEEINKLFETWKNNKLKNKTKSIKMNQYQTSNMSDQFQNFIAFAQYWTKNCSNIYIKYSVYDQLVRDCVDTFMQNQIYVVAFKIGNDQKPFKLKQQPKINKKTKIVQQKCESLTTVLAQKRLKIYFHHFSKMKNLPSGATNSSYSKNGKTFDELGKSFSTINLPQWICFIKGFEFDKIFQQLHKNKQNEQNQLKKKNNKQYLPVKNVKWNSSLHYFKNLFQKFCDNTKQLVFETFTQILKKLFQQIFPDKELKKDTTPTLVNLQFSQKCGIQQLKLSNEEQFNNKLRSFGIFVPEHATRIAHSETKSYGKIKAKYLGLTEPPLLSENKVKQASKSNIKNNENTTILPSIRKKPIKYYTISELMQKNKQHQQQIREQKNLYQSQIIQKQNKPAKQHNKIKIQAASHKKQKLSDKKNNISSTNMKQKPQSSVSKKKKINPQKSCPPNELQAQQTQHQTGHQQEEQDQYLNQYYEKNKSNLFCSNSRYNSNVQPKTQTYHVNKSMQNYNKQGSGYVNYENAHLGNGYGRHLNILRKIDERIDKIHHKLL